MDDIYVCYIHAIAYIFCSVGSYFVISLIVLNYLLRKKGLQLIVL